MVETSPHDYLFTMIIIGDSSVGKTSILRRFALNEYTDNYKETVGIDFKSKKLQIKDKIVKCQVWDTAG